MFILSSRTLCLLNKAKATLRVAVCFFTLFTPLASFQYALQGIQLLYIQYKVDTLCVWLDKYNELIIS